MLPKQPRQWERRQLLLLVDHCSCTPARTKGRVSRSRHHADSEAMSSQSSPRVQGHTDDAHMVLMCILLIQDKHPMKGPLTSGR